MLLIAISLSIFKSTLTFKSLILITFIIQSKEDLKAFARILAFLMNYPEAKSRENLLVIIGNILERHYKTKTIQSIAY